MNTGGPILDARTPPMFSMWRKGGRYFSPISGTIATTAMVSGSLRLAPFPVSELLPVGEQLFYDAYYINPTVGGTASTFRLGMYDDDGQGQPFRLLAGSEQTLATTGTGLLVVTFPAIELPPGLYWLGGASTGTVQPTMRTIRGMSPWVADSTTPSAADTCCYVLPGVTGALPRELTGTLVTTTTMPRIAVRCAQ